MHPPEFRIGKGALKPQLGLANAYSYDRGIAAHPSVVFAGDFSDLSKRRWQSGVVAAGSGRERSFMYAENVPAEPPAEEVSDTPPLPQPDLSKPPAD